MPSPNVGKLFVNAVMGAIAGQWIATIKSEVEIAKIELKYKSRELGKGVAMIAVAAVLGVFLLGVLVAAGVLGLAVVFEPWLAALIAAGGLLLFVLIFLAVGVSKLKKNKDLMPTSSIERIRKRL